MLDKGIYTNTEIKVCLNKSRGKKHGSYIAKIALEIVHRWASVLVRVSIVVMKDHDEKQLMEEKVYFSLHALITVLDEGKPGQELKARTWR